MVETFRLRKLIKYRLCELECLEWRTRPIAGSIAFRIRGAKPRLDLYGYSEDDRLRIIQALRELVPAHLQDGWPPFCRKVAPNLWLKAQGEKVSMPPRESVTTGV